MTTPSLFDRLSWTAFEYGFYGYVATIYYSVVAIGFVFWAISAPFRLARRTWRRCRARVAGGDALRCTKCNTVQYGDEHQYCTQCNYSATEVIYR